MARLALLSVLVVIVILQGVCNGQGDTLMRSIICEGSKATITCPKNKLIEMQTTRWGRKDSKTCATNNMANVNCTSQYAWGFVSTLCDGQQMCKLNAHTSVLGDPCPGTSMYLNVTYMCVDCKNKYDEENPETPKCDYWALQGECVNNAAYMERDCRKSCWKCSGPSEMKALPSTCVNKWRSNVQCEYWASLGDCENASKDWMMANCTRECSPGCKKPEKPCRNFDTDEECDAWAADGECKKNPAYMTAYCKNSCHCHATECTNQYYNHTQCEVWYNQGYCTDPVNSGFMLAQCRQSCFGCIPNGFVNCTNYYFNSTQCDKWAANGECDANPGFMIAQCTKSCLKCTTNPVCQNVDDDTKCQDWADLGECTSNSVNANWMYKNCWKACTQCKGRVPCVNRADPARCDWWAKGGECNKNGAYMNAQCTASCTMCTPKYMSKLCSNMHTNQTECDKWTAEGYCLKDAEWMLSYCRKSCTKCEPMPSKKK